MSHNDAVAKVNKMLGSGIFRKYLESEEGIYLNSRTDLWIDK